MGMMRGKGKEVGKEERRRVKGGKRRGKERNGNKGRGRGERSRYKRSNYYEREEKGQGRRGWKCKGKGKVELGG